jgi:hypothetical protein
MLWKLYALPALLAGIALSIALAQTPATPPPGTPPLRTPGSPVPTVPGTHRTHGTGPANRREPCWQVAGVSKAAMEQRRVVGQQTRQEVEGVCANASLSLSQKQERIRMIHQQERQHMDALISPQQHEAMRVCQQERGGGVHIGGGHVGGGHGSGPCGALPGIAHRMNDTEEDIPKN